VPHYYTKPIDEYSFENCSFYNHRIVNGIDFKLISTLSEFLNFTWTPLFANNVWGRQLSNGTYIGMIGDLYYGRADFALGDLSLTYERSTAVDFSIPYLYSPYTFMTRNNLQLSQIAILKLFSLDVWLTIIGTITISSILMHICLVLTSRKFRFYPYSDQFEVYWIPIISLLLKC